MNNQSKPPSFWSEGTKRAVAMADADQRAFRTTLRVTLGLLIVTLAISLRWFWFGLGLPESQLRGILLTVHAHAIILVLLAVALVCSNLRRIKRGVRPWRIQ